jgi:NAD+--dinitrogen-reductase ADP-D-ribosyltransferase
MADSMLPVNRCDLPPWVIASHLFNRNPLPIEIQGVRRAHRALFSQLDRLENPKARERTFREYMALVFRVGKWRKESSPLGRRSLRNSYLRFLRGWMQDASSPEGAVLKGWAESRFGLPPTFHAGPIVDLHAPAYVLYLVERMRESGRSNAVESQFDLLYEFVQYELRRRNPGVPAFTLYRGVKNLGDYCVIGEAVGNRVVLRLNNLNSFTSRLEHAWQFGSRVLEASVPASKIFFRSDLLSCILPRGEEEALVIGGEYEVTVRLY